MTDKDEDKIYQIQRAKTKLQSSERKMFYGNDAEKKKFYNSLYKDNSISTTKYSIITWFPKSLLLQFTRAANIYFLIISILSCMPFSPRDPFSQAGTFAMVLLFTMLKEGYEDFRRWQQDRKINQRLAMVFDDDSKVFKEKMWYKIRVGDFLKIRKNEELPADMVALKGSDPTGFCHLDTMNLDGETNLKQKATFKQTKGLTEEDVLQMKGKMTCDKPNARLEAWYGKMEDLHLNTALICGIDNILLKGCTLRNSDYVIGVVVYTGHSTKIMKNAREPPIKVSNVMKIMNYLLYSIFFFEIFICVFYSILYVAFQTNEGQYLSYLYKYNENGVLFSPGISSLDFLVKFLVFLVAFSHMIPISLYVMLEILKMFQTRLIACDAGMYDQYTGKNAEARTSDLIEELGQVEFIFSDKTGTLTKNEMVFRKCSINNKIYGQTPLGGEAQSAKYSLNGDASCFKALSNKDNPDRQAIRDFFTICTVCHAANIEVKNGVKIYSSPSPDELAFIEGAKQLGFIFSDKSPGVIETFDEHTNTTSKWNVEIELPFDSTRKKMSMIVNPEGTDEFIMFTKGADSHMLERSEKDSNGNVVSKTTLMQMDPDFKAEWEQQLESFATEALRTLVMARKSLSRGEVEDYKTRLNYINSNLQEKAKEDALQALYAEIEKDYTYVGSSAIEDLLQDNVGDTIESLINAKIRVWVLTGDKKETAEEIGKNCKLILPPSKMDKLDLCMDDEEEFEKTIDEWYYKFYTDKENEEIRKKEVKYSPKNLTSEAYRTDRKMLAIIINSTNLERIFHPVIKKDESDHLESDKIHMKTKEESKRDKEDRRRQAEMKSRLLSRKFIRIGLMANSVLCCRASPAQKAEVVRLAKSNGDWITLSIGDGANDVPMIMEGNIGVGIAGKEGTQAVRSADYAIGQFQFLKRLILVHGRWGYIRVSTFIFYYFYKNIVLVFVELYFSIFSGFSGQIFFPDFLPLLYNSLFTSWPCFYAYVIERDVDDKLSTQAPILYEAGQKRYYFNLKNFWIWILYAFFHGIMIYFGVMVGSEVTLSEEGATNDHWFRSTLCFTVIVHVVTYKLYIELKYWNAMNL